MRCYSSESSCVYHACMSDDCQKHEVRKNGVNWGPGKCELKLKDDPEFQKNKKEVMIRHKFPGWDKL